jgi:hypothetical protein
MTTRRTVTKQQLDESRAAWKAGEFSDEWKPWRHLAAMQAGIIDPPEGTKWDSWADDSPSQRAMLIRAIRETPDDLRHAIVTATRPTWYAVLEGLLRVRDRQAEDVDDREREAAYQRRRGPTPEEATVAWSRLRDMLR